MESKRDYDSKGIGKDANKRIGTERGRGGIYDSPTKREALTGCPVSQS